MLLTLALEHAVSAYIMVATRHSYHVSSTDANPTPTHHNKSINVREISLSPDLASTLAQIHHHAGAGRTVHYPCSCCSIAFCLSLLHIPTTLTPSLHLLPAFGSRSVFREYPIVDFVFCQGFVR